MSVQSQVFKSVSNPKPSAKRPLNHSKAPALPPVKVVSFGEELYERAAAAVAKNMKDDINYRHHVMNNIDPCAVVLKSNRNSEAGKYATEDCLKPRKCPDFSQPQFNSSKHASKAIVDAIDKLRELPLDVEKRLRNDEKFKLLATQKVQ